MRADRDTVRTNEPHRLTTRRHAHPTGAAFLALLVAIALGLPALAAALVYREARTALIAQAQDSQRAATQAMADDVEASINFAEGLIREAASRSTTIETIEREDERELVKILAAMYTTGWLYESVAVLDPDGQLLATFPQEPVTPFDLTGDGTGEVVTTVRGTDALYPVQFPITAFDGAPLGTLVAEIALHRTARGFASFTFGEAGTASLVTADGDALLSSSRERRGTSLAAPELAILTASLEADDDSRPAPLVRSDVISTVMAVPDRPLGIIVDLPAAEAVAPARRLLSALVLIVGSLLVVSAGVIAFVVLRLRAAHQKLAALHAEAAEQSVTDSLTGLLNRRGFDEAFARELERGQRLGYGIGVSLIDLDGFKPLNDTFGHPVGDVCLQTVAAGLRDCVRSTDVVARVGGDEFAVVHVGCDGSQLPAASRRLDEGLNSLEQTLEDGTVLALRASVGSAPVSGGASQAEALRVADDHLYAAKSRRQCSRPDRSTPTATLAGDGL